MNKFIEESKKRFKAELLDNYDCDGLLDEESLPSYHVDQLKAQLEEIKQRVEDLKINCDCKGCGDHCVSESRDEVLQYLIETL